MAITAFFNLFFKVSVSAEGRAVLFGGSLTALTKKKLEGMYVVSLLDTTGGFAAAILLAYIFEPPFS